MFRSSVLDTVQDGGVHSLGVGHSSGAESAQPAVSEGWADLADGLWWTTNDNTSHAGK